MYTHEQHAPAAILHAGRSYRSVDETRVLPSHAAVPSGKALRRDLGELDLHGLAREGGPMSSYISIGTSSLICNRNRQLHYPEIDLEYRWAQVIIQGRVGDYMRLLGRALSKHVTLRL